MNKDSANFVFKILGFIAAAFVAGISSILFLLEVLSYEIIQKTKLEDMNISLIEIKQLKTENERLSKIEVKLNTLQQEKNIVDAKLKYAKKFIDVEFVDSFTYPDNFDLSIRAENDNYIRGDLGVEFKIQSHDAAKNIFRLLTTIPQKTM